MMLCYTFGNLESSKAASPSLISQNYFSIHFITQSPDMLLFQCTCLAFSYRPLNKRVTQADYFALLYVCKGLVGGG